MHLLPVLGRSLDEEAAAIDLGHTPADIVALSFSDGDLSALAAAHGANPGLPSLRLANLARLKHPFSVDLYVGKVAAKARFVLVRLLGGLDYWRYGAEELAAAARRIGFDLAIVPGCDRADPRLDALSTLAEGDLLRLWAWFREGGPDNVADALRFAASRLGRDTAWAEPRPVPPSGLHRPLCRPARAEAPHALVVFYRSALFAADTAPIEALADALRDRGARVSAVFVTSLKDAAAATALGALLAADPPDIVLNTTAFSARGVEGRTVIDAADAPVLQVMLSGATRDAWEASSRGCGAADLAMNVVLPEVDGRILAGAISFKGEGPRHDALEFATVSHRPEPSRIAHAADLALAWARLRKRPRPERRLACVLSDYPGKGGRAGYAVGLDTPGSLAAIARHLAGEGFDVAPLPAGADLMGALTAGAATAVMGVADYCRALTRMPRAFVASVEAAWGAPEADAAVEDGSFRFRLVRAGKMVMAVQPDRGRGTDRRADYHDAALLPCHGFVAFYLWLREVERIDAMIHLGTHGTLEWLPGKAVALGEACAPEAVLGPVPVIYPFIVNDPGEAAQAKRRIAAVTVGHLTPPLVAAGSHGAAAELEALFDEYAQAEGLDPRRERLLAAAILDRARAGGLAADCGLADGDDPAAALVRLDAWLCDLKGARIGDGLHVFGAYEAELRSALPSIDDADGTFSHQREKGEAAEEAALRARCGEAERAGLVAALDGRFVPPGPAGSPGRGRLDVLPTGRNLFTADPRAIPTRTACEVGTRAAAEFLARYAQDHGEWPRRVVLDLWGSATMRTGGEDFAHALALIGVRPRWDHGSTRVNGFDIVPAAKLDRPRVDATLRVSGLFRDVFPDQVALFDAAARAVAALEEDDEANPLAEARRAAGAGAGFQRVFGAAPNHYGVGFARSLAGGDWRDRDDLARSYLAASSHVYGVSASEGTPAPEAFAARVREAQAYLHMQDLPDTDLLQSDIFAEHEGGFSAAAALLGGTPALYHGDATRPDGAPAIRALSEEIARVLRARATNPRWLAGMMRHGHRGAAEIAETVDALFAFAATTDAVPGRHFDLLFDATLGDEAVRAFLRAHNPGAARAIAGRFREAAARGFWDSRRNSTAAILADDEEGA